MLTKKEIIAYQRLVFQEAGTRLTFEEAKEWAEDFCGLMTLLIVPQEQHYPTLLYDTEKTMLENSSL